MGEDASIACGLMAWRRLLVGSIGILALETVDAMQEILVGRGAAQWAMQQRHGQLESGFAIAT